MHAKPTSPYPRLLLILCLLFAAFARSAAAVEVGTLFEANVDVTDQSPAQRSAALAQAFTDVMIKLSGSLAVAQNPAVAAEKANAANYLQQYRYRTRSSPDGNDQRYLWVRFDGKAMEAFLDRNGLPVWGHDRPTVVVWLALQQGPQRVLLGANSQDPLRGVLLDAAMRRGLPVTLPQLDDQDQTAVQVTDVWGNFGDVLVRASKRYNADAVLVGRAVPLSSGNWGVRWTLYRGDGAQGETWQDTGPDAASAVAAGIGGATDRLALEFATTRALQFNDHLTVSVDGIKGLADYARVERYLTSLDPVTSVQPYQIVGEQIIFNVQARGGLPALSQAIALGRLLVAQTPSSATVPTAAGTLSYRLAK